jgi:Beta-galactosidase trimerisation domain
VRNSWTKLIEDLGLQYNFVSNPQVEAGKLSNGEYRAFIMTQSIAISEHEADQVREFVRAGGLLIADCRTATMNEHGRDLGHGQLDDVFGITRGAAQTAGQSVRGTGNEGSLQLEGKELRLLKPGDETLKTTKGRALAESGSVPLVIVNQFGSGRAVFLNLEVADYAYQRLQASLDTSLPELMEAVFGLAQISPRLRVLGPDGKRLPGTEAVFFANGACEHVAIFRNPQFDDGGWGSYPTLKERGWAGSIDNSLFEKEAQVSLEWSEARQTYDIRGRKDLGALKSHKAILNPMEPLVFTRSTQPLPKFGLGVPSQVKVGETLRVTFRDESPLPEGTSRVIRLDITDPSGKAYELYARNVLIHATPQQESIPIAFNDPKGRWHVQAHDIMTGQVEQASFDLG